MNNDQESFLFDEKQTKRMMRKARFRSTLKIIGITVIITPILLLVLLYSLRQLNVQNAHKAMDDIRMYKEIS
ncbi:MAG: sigma factor regulator N-terminal domain-containing protein, partial [Solibacillus sp.]